MIYKFTDIIRRAQDGVRDLQWWWALEDNAVLFAQFWLADIDAARRTQLTAMEGELLTQELSLAFQAAGNGWRFINDLI